MREIVNKAEQFGASDSTILITGETGTGKEILAQGIHNLSARSKHPFVSINCAALPDSLLESELFGYEEGSFTGSRKGGKPGLFEVAHKGTIFLDEIGSTPENVQRRLLRVIQEKEVMRIGGDRLIPVDVRVITASNKDLRDETLSGRFREDLYFRLNVLSIFVPPLRDRIEDIPVLTQEFIKRSSAKYARQPIIIPLYYLNTMMEYSWPGNVRQLENFIEQLVLLCELGFRKETFMEIYFELIEYASHQKQSQKEEDRGLLKAQSELQKKAAEERILRDAMGKTNFSKTKAAKMLGISRTTLWKKLKELGVH